MSFTADYGVLQKSLQNPIERILSNDKPSKSEFMDKELLTYLFDQGEENTQNLFEQLEQKAVQCGAARVFRSAYQKAKITFLRQKYNLSYCKPLDIPGFSLDEAESDQEKNSYFLPAEYDMDFVKGVLHFDYDSGKYIPVFPHPIILSERYQNIDNGAEKNKVLYLDNGEIKSLICNASTLSNTQSIIQLRDRGIRVTSENAKDLVKFLSALLDVNLDKIPVLPSTIRLGWQNSHFKSFLPFTKDVVFDGEIDYQTAFQAIHSNGDYAAWKQYMQEFALPNDIVRFYLASSLGSVLVSVLKKLPFIVHIWGGSGCGKTVGLYVACSVWGKPDDMTITYNCTKVALEKYAGMYHNFPLPINEGEANDKRRMTFQDFGYMFCEGKGRGRGTKTGGVDIIPTWQSIALSNAENSMLSGDSKEGFVNRVLEFYIDKPLFADLPHTADFVKENYGFAGKDFLGQLQGWLEDDEKRQWLNQYYDLFYTYCTAHGTEKQAMAMAVVLLADMLMHHFIFGLELFQAQEVTSQYATRIIGILKTKQDVDITARAYDYFCGWMAEHLWYFDTKNRYDVDDGSNVVCRECYGRVENNTVWIITSRFDQVMQDAGFDTSKTIKEFAERGILVKGKDRKSSVPKRVNKVLARCYQIFLKEN